MELLRVIQLNILQVLGSICGMLALFVLITRSIDKRRKICLIAMELGSMFLLLFDRYAYIYRGDVSHKGYVMVRVCNFVVFFCTSFVIFAFNAFLKDLLLNEGRFEKIPVQLKICDILFVIAEILIIISQFTGFYYTFDEYNRYQRAPGFLISYLFPVAILALELYVVIKNYYRLRKMTGITLFLFTFVLLAASIIQLFTYGISFINISLVGMVIVLYLFSIRDMNETVARAGNIEIDLLKQEQKAIHRLFEQTAEALANAIDAKDTYTHGHSARVAEYARKIAEASGMDEKECQEVYFAGLLHDVGKIGVPNHIINKAGKLTDEEYDVIKSHPVIGKQILSSISESPYLSIGANHHHERYDGKGYPDRLKGEDIPRIARIIAVADAYDAMTSKRSYRDPIPQQKVREEIVKGMETQFDPEYAKIMLQLIDRDTNYEMKEKEEIKELAGRNGLSCDEIGADVSEGIYMNPAMTTISFTSVTRPQAKDLSSVPTLIIFDSLDARVYLDEKRGKDLLYYEYGRIRLDGEVTAGGIRNVKTESVEHIRAGKNEWLNANKEGLRYSIEGVRIEDHLLIRVTDKFKTTQIIMALPDKARFAYIGLTGEQCDIVNVQISRNEKAEAADYIPRIAEEISFISGPEGDVPNIEVAGWRAASTDGIPVEGDMTLTFHSMSLPTARLVWHCPYVSLFYSKDGHINGEDYKEFVLVRFDGENWESDETVENRMLINKNDDFTSWDEWKNLNKQGLDYTVYIKKEGNKVEVRTENAGISIVSTTIIKIDVPKVYLSITGDQVAITNIRIS